MHRLREGYGSTRVNYQKVIINKAHAIINTALTDDIGSLRLRISIYAGGCKGERGQENSAEDEPACSDKSVTRIPGHREVRKPLRDGCA